MLSRGPAPGAAGPAARPDTSTIGGAASWRAATCGVGVGRRKKYPSPNRTSSKQPKINQILRITEEPPQRLCSLNVRAGQEVD
ncbi:hypothetical protein GCM10023172_34990 [Hymenobacter ginsengisoli]|uniref:Uncharacterized protein n=1 Tax=Hymenobacter ginsengisoli TaxID=1051626 RepID=A0ABP8QPF8_9BACT